MSERPLLLNPATEISPVDETSFDLKVVQIGTTVRATAYQTGLLHHFSDPATVESVLTRFPFSKDTSLAFLQACRRAYVLVEKRSDGRLELPDRVPSKASSTLLSMPAFELTRPPAFCFLGVPYDGATSGEPGARFGPVSVREASEGYRYQIDPLTLRPAGFLDLGTGRTILRGVALADAGDVRVEPGESQEAIFARTTQAVRQIVEAGSIPLVIGGDHAVSYAVLAALPLEDVSIVHFDAHSDLAPYLGDLHHGNVFSVVLEKLGYVNKLHQFGLRGYVEPELGKADPQVFRFGLDQLRKMGTAAFVEELPNGVPYYVSIDIDVLDPSFAPATGTPVPGGLFPYELKELLFTLATERDVIGADVVEVAATSGVGDGTGHFALDALLAVAAGIVERVLSEESENETHD
ncbi:MAG: arginase family protein [Deltaproteobacteria bacterium]|nr:arginase family protein [Deltaproteobacteria bacterium]